MKEHIKHVEDKSKRPGEYERVTLYMRIDTRNELERIRREEPHRSERVDLSDIVEHASAVWVALQGGATGRVPVVGRVAAGSPILAEQIDAGYVEVPAGMISPSTIALTVRGRSMEPSIRDGDVIIVRRQHAAERGETVVAMVGDDQDGTVKRYYPGRDSVELRPENGEFQSIRSSEVKIVGKVIGVVSSRTE